MARMASPRAEARPAASVKSLLLPPRAFLPHLALLLLFLFAIHTVAERLIWTDRDGEIFRSLEIRARLLENRVTLLLTEASRDSLQEFMKEMGRISRTRFTVTNAAGKVLADSLENPQRLENHAGRPEIAGALGGGVGNAKRFSQSLRTEMLYCAIPLYVEGRVTAVLRTAEPAPDTQPALTGIRRALVAGGLVLVLASAGFMVFSRRRVLQGAALLREGAARFAAGDFSRRIRAVAEGELDGLAPAMNRMAECLDALLHAAVLEKNQLEALFASMAEGVVALNREERIFRINQAAVRFLGVPGGGDAAIGRNILEVVRNTSLQELVRETFRDRTQVEREITVSMDAGTCFLQVRGIPLPDTPGAAGGALIVMHDMTGIRKLEIMRRDFVANVSHELKTPITSIKGFVETLLGGAMHDGEDCRRFLEIVERQAERLNVIVDDLLALSRLELDAEGGGIHRENTILKEVLVLAAQVCDRKATDKSIRLVIECPETLSASLNPQLIEQVLVNLVDNAIKYSDPGKQVRIEGRQEEGAVIVAVHDQGPGIAPEHLPRLFERFYRIDKARSRKMGGTGLGLAIVKHIVQAHGGQVRVQSETGKGSIFTVLLPG